MKSLRTTLSGAAAIAVLAVAPLMTPAVAGQVADDAKVSPVFEEDGAEPLVETRIVGGTQAREGAWPYAGRLRAMTTETGGFTCGSTLISPDILLTAAHCLEGDGKHPDPTWAQVYIGKVDWQQAKNDPNHHFKASSQKQFAKGPGAAVGDWAVIKLDRPVSGVPFAKIASDTSLDNNRLFRAIGWGTTSSGGEKSQYLLEVDLNGSNPTKCNVKYPNSELCVGGDVGGKDTCQGDSGGPLFTKNARNEWVQVGITSWGVGCGRQGNQGHYARVSTFYNDIMRAIDSIGGTRPGGVAPTPQPTTPQPTTPQPTTPQPTTPQPTTPQPTQPVPNPGGNEFSNNTPAPINDYAGASSVITSTKTDSKRVTVNINISHPCLQQLEIAITTPDGVRNVVKRSASTNRCQEWNGVKSESYPLNSKSDGQWKLEVNDQASRHTGTLNGWSIKFD